MNKYITTILSIAVLVLVVIGFTSFAKNGQKQPEPTPASGQSESTEKAYIAVEGAGEVVVFDTQARSVVKRIDLSSISQMGKVSFMPHNVQVAPNGKIVWVTANAIAEMNHAGSSFLSISKAFADEGPDDMESVDDEVIVINPATDTIIKRIPLGRGLHLSHVAVTPDSNYAVVASQEKNLLYKINAGTFTVEQQSTLPPESGPHGLRISPDGATAYIAMLNGKSMGVLDISTFAITYTPLNGGVVQTGVTPDGKYAVASVYDTKSLAVYNTQTKKVTYVVLPAEAKGPVQMYPTPDSKFIYLADQGYYFKQPNSNMVYKVSIDQMKVVKEIKAGIAPHGTVISKDGSYVYITNLLSDDMSIIDTKTDSEVVRLPIGKQPNGISLWSKQSGGTP